MITTRAIRTRLSSFRRAVPVSPLVETSQGGANRITSALTPAKRTRAKISSSSRPSRLLHRDERFMAFRWNYGPYRAKPPSVHQLLQCPHAAANSFTSGPGPLVKLRRGTRGNRPVGLRRADREARGGPGDRRRRAGARRRTGAPGDGRVVLHHVPRAPP